VLSVAYVEKRSPTNADIHITKQDATKNTAKGILGITRFFKETRIFNLQFTIFEMKMK